MEKLVAGYRKFRDVVYPLREEQFAKLESGQQPRVLFITCADSRIVPELLFQAEPGELFICRNAGNIVPGHGDHTGGVSATVEYAVRALNVKEIVVCGHSDCGVMRALLHPERVAPMKSVSSWLGYGERARAVVEHVCGHMDEEEKVMELARQNVLAQLDNLRTHPSVAARMAARTLNIHGWILQLHTGSVQAWSEDSNQFEALENVYHPVGSY